jgi:hypothetical protein
MRINMLTAAHLEPTISFGIQGDEAERMRTHFRSVRGTEGMWAVWNPRCDLPTDVHRLDWSRIHKLDTSGLSQCWHATLMT